MRRREFLGSTAVMGLGLAGARSVGSARAAEPGTGEQVMKAGFARAVITPPAGTTMMGFGARDMKQGCTGVHDDIYARALFLEHAGEQALIMGLDLCLMGRPLADRLKGAIGRVIDLSPRQILLNASHNHMAPSTGTWYSAGYTPPDRLYRDALERAAVRAAREARDALREATLWAGATRTDLPLSRRKPDGRGGVIWAPYPEGITYDRVPVCLFRDPAGKPICLLFSISTHPSMIGGHEISAEYPGAAMRMLDAHLGTAASLFLQGMAGDSKPAVIGVGRDSWGKSDWAGMERAGAMVADPVIGMLKKGLGQVQPALRSAATETFWSLEKPPPRSEFEAIAAQPEPQRARDRVRWWWAKRQLELLGRGHTLPSSAPIWAQGVQLAKGVRLFALEGEPVAEWGPFVEQFYGSGVTFPLGYSNGQGLYLPVSRMLPEGGYEVESYWEYGFPAPLAEGMERVVLEALTELRGRGIS